MKTTSTGLRYVRRLGAACAFALVLVTGAPAVAPEIARCQAQMPCQWEPCRSNSDCKIGCTCQQKGQGRVCA